MMDLPSFKKWVQHNYFRKVDSTDTTRGAQDANRPLVLNSSGYIDSSVYGGTWANLAYTNSGGTTWTNYDGTHQAGQYMLRGDMVYLRGLCKRTAGAGAVIGTLPALYRPLLVATYGVLCSGGLGQIDVYPDGSITFSGAGVAYVQLSIPPFSVV